MSGNPPEIQQSPPPNTGLQRPPSYLGYETISQWIDAIAPQLRDSQFVAVAAILRGGLFPAQCASFVAGVPLAFIGYDRQQQRARWVGEPPPPGRLLICEDMAGYGYTLVNCKAFVEQTHADYRVLTVVSDEFSRTRPDWSMHRPDVQSVLPWERELISPHFQRDWLEGGADGRRAMDADHVYRYWAVDLDGVLCDDLAPRRYAQDMDAALAERDGLPRAARAPQLIPRRHIIVTGRPLHDSRRTRSWLDAQGYGGIDVIHRDPRQYEHDDAAIAAYKSAAAQRLGITDFIESCPHQAVLIAAHAPHMRVHWWRRGDPVLINATPTAL